MSALHQIDGVEQDLKNKFTQWRICQKLEPSVIDTNFMYCLKKMFNKNYKSKTECWWAGRGIIDVAGIKAEIISMLHARDIVFVDVFVDFKENPMELNMYVLLPDNQYYQLTL